MFKSLSIILAVSLSNIANASEVESLTKRYESQYGLQNGMLRTILLMESNLNANAVNLSAPVPSYGISQITMQTFTSFCGGTRENIMDIRANMACAARYLAFQLKRFNGDIRRTIMAYNEGTPCECRNGVYQRVLKRRSMICKNWVKGNQGWSSKPARCSVEGELRITDYYRRYSKLQSIALNQ